MERVGLSEWKNKKWEELSKGMQQKVQFVSTILHDPDLIILDEPFSGLDPINASLLKEIVQELKARNKTIIFSTHLMEQAEQMCDSICLVNRGRSVINGNIRAIKRTFLNEMSELKIALEAEDYAGVLEDHALVSPRRFAEAPNAHDFRRVYALNLGACTVEPQLHRVLRSVNVALAREGE